MPLAPAARRPEHSRASSRADATSQQANARTAAVSPEHRSQNSMLPRCEHAADLLTRWPALDVAAKRDRLRRSLRDHARANQRPRSRRRGAGSTRGRRDVAAGSVGLERVARRAGHDRQPARLARLADPDGRLARSAPSFCRRRQARRLHRCRAARDGRIEPGARSAASRSSARRPAGRGSTCSTRRIPTRSARPPRRPDRRSICSPASRARRSNRTRSRPTSAARWRTRASRAGRIISSPSPTKAPSSRDARAPSRFARPSSTRRTSAGATRRCRSSAWCRPR